MSTAAVKISAKAFIEFLNKAVTPFHAVEECRAILEQAGFTEVNEADNFAVHPGDKYFMQKNHSSIFAFTVGGKYTPGNGYSIVVAHTDSPCLRIKPISKRETDQFLQIGVTPYGGGLWRTWFDRDLSVAGQVLFKRGDRIHRRIVDIRRPILFIPSLAIHLDRSDKFEFNTECHLLPIFATNLKKSDCDKKDCADGDESKLNCSITAEHHAEFLKLMADEAGCTVNELLDMDLYLYDTQPATLGGVREEFIVGARLDNLVGTYTAISGLLDSLKNPKVFESDPNIRLVACFDNEEVGSQSAQGAGSSFTEWLLRRLSASPDVKDPTSFERSIANSYMISADQVHAAHPNYAQKHEDKHRPIFHGGVTIKVNVNQRYATTSITHAVLKVIADKANVPLQKMVVRNDSPCGSTVGPIVSTLLGLRTIDLGCPQLAMHSIREFADTSSILQATNLFSKFFEELPNVLRSVDQK